VPIRLQKILSQAGVSSRRVAEELIRQGRVEVNRQVITELGTKADPAADDIRVDGRRIAKVGPARRYLLLNKPRGVVSTRDDPQRRTTVIELLARAGIHGYFYPVGRLDYDSDGLLILTNDGDFAEAVAHPRHELERAYDARVLGVPDPRDIARMAGGIVIEGRRTLPARVTVRGSQPVAGEVQTRLEIVIREGRNRQVRRMCEAIGHPIVRLTRTRIGPITGRGLAVGEIRDLTEREIAVLRGADGAALRPSRQSARRSSGQPARGARRQDRGR
jgi:pseudouridine synthase